MAHTNWPYPPTQVEVHEKIYDEAPDMRQVPLLCRQCGSEDTLVENTMVPRSMGAELLLDDEGRYVVNLVTAQDDAFWEAEIDHKWGCSSCVNEGENIADVFEIGEPEDD